MVKISNWVFITHYSEYVGAYFTVLYFVTSSYIALVTHMHSMWHKSDRPQPHKGYAPKISSLDTVSSLGYTSGKLHPQRIYGYVSSSVHDVGYHRGIGSILTLFRQISVTVRGYKAAESFFMQMRTF